MRNGQVQENYDESVLVGCKKKEEKLTAFRPITLGVNIIPIWNDFQKFEERIQIVLSNVSAIKWLGSFKYMCKKMLCYRFVFFVWNIVDRHNKRKERQLMKAGLM